MKQQLIIMLVTLAIFALLGYGMYRSIRKHDTDKLKTKKKKSRSKYMPQVKNPGK